MRARALLVPALIAIVGAAAAAGAPAAGAAALAVKAAGTPSVGQAGLGWAASQAPLPRNALRGSQGGAQLDAIDCPTVQRCVAVGYYTDKSGRRQGVILTRNDRRWTAVEAPLPPDSLRNPQVRLTSVSCPGARTCLIVGRYDLNNNAAAVGLLLTGGAGSWKARRAPLPANAYTGKAFSSAVDLNAVDCPDTKTCVVAGTYTAKLNKSVDTQGLLLTYSKGTWRSVEAPAKEVNLVSVSCASATSCAAVGTGIDPENSFFTIGVVVAGFGKTWEAGKAPLFGTAPTTSQSDLQSVSCTPDICTAVGNFMPPGGTTPDEMLVMDGKGAHWQATEEELPESGTEGEGPVFRVACPGVKCVFSALYFDASFQSVAALLTLSSTWTTHELKPPVASYRVAGLSALACGSKSSCTAVGTYAFGSKVTYRPLIQQGIGSSWKGPLAPLPAGARKTREAGLIAVSCPSAATCVAVGSYTVNSVDQGLLLTH